MAKGALKRFAIGTTVAAAAGYVVGVLTAPRAGKDMRETLRGKAGDRISSVENQFHSTQEDVKHLIDEANERKSRLSDKAKQELEDAKTLAIDARDKAQLVLTAVRRGEANDAQLQRAINDVKAAGTHLKTFITKTPGTVTKNKARATKRSTTTKSTTSKSTKRDSK